MKTRTYTKTGAEISLLGLGCMRLPVIEPGKPAIDEEKAMEMVDTAMARGINYYDTAWFYHERTSEAFMGKALSRFDRDSYYLATKMPVSILEKEEDIPTIFAKQLENLQTDHFDFYLCHALSASNFEKMEKMGVYEFLKQKKDEGVIRQLGFSSTIPSRCCAPSVTPTNGISPRSSSTIWIGKCRTPQVSIRCWRSAASLSSSWSRCAAVCWPTLATMPTQC